MYRMDDSRKVCTYCLKTGHSAHQCPLRTNKVEVLPGLTVIDRTDDLDALLDFRRLQSAHQPQQLIDELAA